MEVCLFVEPQMGATYKQQLAAAHAAEAAGLHGFFRSDHFLTMGGDGRPGPTDAWVTLGSLARETERVRLGTLMTSATFRQPGILAVTVAQVDEMSGGRVELGLGAGWFEAEHKALGIPFPSWAERFEKFEEQLHLLALLLRGAGPVDHAGRHYHMEGNPALPRPRQPGGPPVIVGGSGPRRTPRLAARYASEYNLFAPTAERFEERVATAAAACEEVGREPASLRLSVVQTICVGKDDAEVARRAARIGRDVADLRANNAGGTSAEVLDRLGSWRDRGVVRVYLQLLDIDDLDQVGMIGAEVLPALA